MIQSGFGRKTILFLQFKYLIVGDLKKLNMKLMSNSISASMTNLSNPAKHFNISFKH